MVIDAFLACLFNVHYLIFFLWFMNMHIFYEYIWKSVYCHPELLLVRPLCVGVTRRPTRVAPALPAQVSERTAAAVTLPRGSIVSISAFLKSLFALLGASRLLQKIACHSKLTDSNHTIL